MARSIQLQGDLSVDPVKEAGLVEYFEGVYRPTAMRFEGYIDLQLLKLRGAVAGHAPAGVNYRFSITFASEELRLTWVASDAHQQVWSVLDAALTSHDLDFLLFEVICARYQRRPGRG